MSLRCYFRPSKIHVTTFLAGIYASTCYGSALRRNAKNSENTNGHEVRGCSCCILRPITICSNLNPCAIRYLHNTIHNHQPFTSLLLQCHQMTKSKHIIRYKQPSTEGVTLRNESGYIITEGRGNNFIN